MAEHRIIIKLNQQQLELIDRTIAQGAALDRTSLVRKALHEYAIAHQNGTQDHVGQPGGDHGR